MKPILLLFLATFLTLSAYAQQDYYRWRVGVSAGYLHYYGDLNQRFFAPTPQLRNDPLDYLTYGASVEYSLGPAWSARLSYTRGAFTANDRAINWDGALRTDATNFGRALNARTEIRDAAFMFTYYFDNDQLLSRRAFLSPYFSFGVGVTDFEVFGDLFYGPGQDQRYFYWTDNTIRDRPQDAPDAAQAVEVSQNGQFETNLTQLRTEDEAYSTRVLHIPVGVGLKFRLSSRVNLNLDLTARYAFTDYLDDVSQNYLAFDDPQRAYASNPSGTGVPGEPRGNPNRDFDDIYTFTSVSLHYNFGLKKDSYRAPRLFAPLASSASPLLPAAPPRADEATADTAQAERAPSDAGARLQPFLLDMNRLPRDTVARPTFGLQDLQRRTDSLVAARSLADSATALRFGRDSLVLSPTGARLAANNPVAESLMRAPDTLATDTLAAMPDTLSMRSTTLDSLPSGSSAITRRAPMRRPYLVPFNPLPAPRDTARADTLLQATTLAAAQPDTSLRRMEAQLEAQAREMAELRQLLAARRDTALAAAPASRLAPGDTLPRDRDAGRELDRLRTENQALRSQPRASNQTSNTVIPVPIPAGGGQTTERVVDTSGTAALNRRIEALEVELRRARDNRDNYGGTRTQTTTLAGVASPTATSRDSTVLAAERDSLQGVIRAAEADLAARRDTATADDQGVAQATADLDRLRQQLGSREDSLVALRDQLAEAKRIEMRLQEFRQSQIYFELNSVEVSAADGARIAQVADLVAQYPAVQILLRGFTDKTGNAQYNLRLSQQRAKAVRDRLTSGGVAEDRIRVEYYGADLTPGMDSSYGRRVEIVLTAE